MNTNIERAASITERRSLLQVDVYETFMELENAIADACENIQQRCSGMPAWVVNEFDVVLRDDAARAAACKCYRSIFYTNAQESNDVYTMPGVIGVTPDITALIERVNGAKCAFQAARQALAEILAPKQVVILANDMACRHAANQELLETLRKPRLHLRQTDRLIHMLSDDAYRLRISWNRTNSISKISYAELSRRIMRLYDADKVSSVEWDRFLALSPDCELRIVKDYGALRLRANVFNQQGSIIEKPSAGMPLVYTLDSKASHFPVTRDFPSFRPQQSNRRRRTAAPNTPQVEEIPYLKCLNIHRLTSSPP